MPLKKKIYLNPYNLPVSDGSRHFENRFDNWIIIGYVNEPIGLETDILIGRDS